MYVCLGKHTYLETRGMYVCQRYVYLGKHTYLENDRYVCMSAETYIPRNYRYVCVSGETCLGKHTYLETPGMYVCMSKVCISGETYIPYVWGNIHT